MKNAKLGRSPGSITGWLTLLHTLSASVLLIMVTAFLYEALVTSLREEDKEFLVDKTQTLQVLMQESGENRIALEQEIQWEGVTGKITPYYAYFSRLLDAGGRVVIETPGMAERIPAAAFVPPKAETNREDLAEHTVVWHTPEGHAYLLLAALGTSQTGESRVIQIALDISREDALLSDYRHKLMIILPLGILFSAMLGVLIARRGMRHLRNITRIARRVSASRLQERIEPARWPLELRSLAEAFDQMLGRLDDSFTRLSRFSADLAHELRTPVNNLMGEAEVALSRHRSEREYREALESNLEEGERLSRMIDSLLFLARADRDQLSLQRFPLDARKELEAIRDYHEAAAEEQGVTVLCEGEGEVWADPVLFRRAVTNVLANALRHTRAGGRVTLRIARATEGVEIHVMDTGCGIAVEHLPKVFDRFYRVDPARSADAQSTGLGLAIVQSIMATHGGTASMESCPGQGTTVMLRFPKPPI